MILWYLGSASGQNTGPKCVGAKRVCKFFYDSAPSGSYGTLSYLVRGACKVLDCIPNEGDIECKQMWFLDALRWTWISMKYCHCFFIDVIAIITSAK